MSEKTIFKKIIDGELPCHKIYEDDNFLVFLDIFPVAPGHTLIIPKTEERWVWDVQQYSAYWDCARMIAYALRKAFGTDMIRCEVYGEQVPHAHIKLFPEIPKDGSETDFATITEKIKKAL